VTIEQCGNTELHEPHDACAGLSEYDVIVRVGCPDCMAPPAAPCRFSAAPRDGSDSWPATAVHASRRDLALTERGTCKLCSLLLLHDKRTGRVWHPEVITQACPPLPNPATRWNDYAAAIQAGAVPGQPGIDNFVPWTEPERDDELDESIRSALLEDAITAGYDPTAGAYDGLTATDQPLLCPECRNGKHPNCDGHAWDQTADAPAPCECPEPEHTR